jgi:chemotaxis protein histidine kinase CheA
MRAQDETMQLREYFVTEAEELLAGLERTRQDEPGGATVAELQRCARGLRGLARLANEDRVATAASALEQASRSPDFVQTPDGLDDRVRASIDDFRVLIEGGESAELDARRDAIVGRWTGLKTEAAADAADTNRSSRENPFYAFVIRESRGIADVMERGIGSFAETPGNRDWLGAILRRQRALLGAARLGEVAVVAETLHAVEDMAQLIVRLNVPIKSEWLDVFRSAREVLRASAVSLEQGEPPRFTPALSRLRTLRDELWDRYGDKSSPHADPNRGPERVAPSSSASSAPLPLLEPELDAPFSLPMSEATAPVSNLERAASLRAEIERAIGGDARAREALDELHGMLLEALQ